MEKHSKIHNNHLANRHVMWAFAINWCLLSRLLTFHIWIFSSETALLNELKLGRDPTTFKLEGEVTSLSESSQGEVGDFWEKLIVINRNIVSRPLWRYPAQI